MLEKGLRCVLRRLSSVHGGTDDRPAFAVARVVGTALSSLVAAADRLHAGPGAKRVHLFEDESGGRGAPFGSLPEGAARSTTPCRDCGDSVNAGSYRYCRACLDCRRVD